jgi:signal transduction histidine kinase
MNPSLPTPSGRELTDDSLRVEREEADLAFAELLASINATADAAIMRARSRAQQVLTLARQRADDLVARTPSAMRTETAASGEQARSSRAAATERALADRVLQEEQGDADQALQHERAEYGSPHLHERHDTDSKLKMERTHSDDVIATRDEVLGIVSHELRNMLHSVVGFAELIEVEIASKAASEALLVSQTRCIQRAAARMDRLIGDLADIASIESGMLFISRQPTDPAMVVTEAVELFQQQAAAKELSLTADIAAASPPADFDAARVLQVLVNLLSNALKFTPRKGKVVVRMEQIDGAVRFAVSDTGIGIDAAQIEKVFERYWQVCKNDARGAGLGLYISKRIVLAHGGKIWAESKGLGTTFFFTIPSPTADALLS